MTNLDYLYNPAAAKAGFSANYFSNKKLGFQVIEHGMILPRRNRDDEGNSTWIGYGGIVKSNNDYVKESYIHYGTGNKYTPPMN